MVWLFTCSVINVVRHIIYHTVLLDIQNEPSIPGRLVSRSILKTPGAPAGLIPHDEPDNLIDSIHVNSTDPGTPYHLILPARNRQRR